MTTVKQLNQEQYQNPKSEYTGEEYVLSDITKEESSIVDLVIGLLPSFAETIKKYQDRQAGISSRSDEKRRRAISGTIL